MDTQERTSQEQRRRPANQSQQRQSGQQVKKQAPAQTQTSAQRRAVKHQQAQRQAAAREQKQRAQARKKPAARPSAPAATKKKRKTNQGLLGGLKMPQLGKKTNARANREQAARAAKLKAMKQEVNQKEQLRRERRRVSKPKSPAVPIVYTAPATFNAHRLVMQLVTIFAVVLAAVMCMSIFFKVERIEVSGANVYEEWTVREASGIQEGDNLLTFSRGRASGRIKTQLQYVEKVRFGIKLPNTVIIDIKEFDVVYTVKGSDGAWYLINSNGKIVDQTDGGTAGNYTEIKGIELSGPIIGDQARAAEEIVAAPESNKSEESTEQTTPVVLITNQSRLDTALRILRELEANGIVGEAASVNVSDLSHIELWYGTRYQVNLGDENDMDRKIADMKGTINQLADYQTGMLDISYDIWEDKVGYTPFS